MLTCKNDLIMLQCIMLWYYQLSKAASSILLLYPTTVHTKYVYFYHGSCQIVTLRSMLGETHAILQSNHQTINEQGQECHETQ